MNFYQKFEGLRLCSVTLKARQSMSVVEINIYVHSQNTVDSLEFSELKLFDVLTTTFTFAKKVEPEFGSRHTNANDKGIWSRPQAQEDFLQSKFSYQQTAHTCGKDYAAMPYSAKGDPDEALKKCKVSHIENKTVATYNIQDLILLHCAAKQYLFAF